LNRRSKLLNEKFSYAKIQLYLMKSKTFLNYLHFFDQIFCLSQLNVLTLWSISIIKDLYSLIKEAPQKEESSKESI